MRYNDKLRYHKTCTALLIASTSRSSRKREAPHVFTMWHRCKNVQGISDFFLHSVQRRAREKVRVDSLEVMLLLTVENMRAVCAHP